MSAFRLSLSCWRGGMSGGLATGFGDHDIVVQFRNGAGVTTPILSRRVTAATTLVAEFAASAVQASAGANTIEVVRTGRTTSQRPIGSSSTICGWNRPTNNTAPILAQPGDSVVDEQNAF